MVLISKRMLVFSRLALVFNSVPLKLPAVIWHYVLIPFTWYPSLIPFFLNFDVLVESFSLIELKLEYLPRKSNGNPSTRWVLRGKPQQRSLSSYSVINFRNLVHTACFTASVLLERIVAVDETLLEIEMTFHWWVCSNTSINSRYRWQQLDPVCIRRSRDVNLNNKRNEKAVRKWTCENRMRRSDPEVPSENCLAFAG